MPIFVLLLLISLSALGHQTNLTGGGKPLRWGNKNVPIAIKANSQTINPSSATQIIRNSINEWNQTTSAQIVEQSHSLNEVSFSSDFSMFGPSVIGMTEVIYNESSGNIQKASVILNEDHFQFSATPGFQSHSYKIFLGDVVTHELGHLFGLSHSEVLDSTMFYSTFPGQSTLAADDKAGIRSKYDSQYGKISGFIKGGSNIGVLGTHIQAISLRSGESIGTVSRDDGSFEIAGLDLEDSYYLYTSPVKNVNSLPGYFSTLQTAFCPAAYVGSFFNACGKYNEGLPQKIRLSTLQPEVNVGTVTINCSLRTSEDYSYEKVQQNFQPVTIFDSSVNEGHHLAFTGYFRSNELSTSSFLKTDKLRVDLSHFLALGGNQKFLKVSLISQPLGSPVEYRLNVKRNNVSQTGILSKSYNQGVGTLKLDLFAEVALQSNATSNVFDLEIQGKRLPSEDLADAIPSAGIFSSSQHFPYLVMVSVWEQSSYGKRPYEDTEASLSDNRNCLDAPFTYAVSTPKVTGGGSKSTVSDKSEAAAVAGCGTIEPPQGGGPGSSLPMMTLGFLLCLLASQLVKSRKNFLS